MPAASERQPELPLLIWESGDLYVYDSIAEAESGLEAIDVKHGIFEGFDAAGRLLKLGVSIQQERVFGPFSIDRESVTVSLTEEMAGHRAELHQILLEFLTSIGLDPDALRGMSHEELVSEARRAQSRRYKWTLFCHRLPGAARRRP